MSAFELIKLGRMLHHAGIVSREKDTMDLMMILPDGYELDNKIHRATKSTLWIRLGNIARVARIFYDKTIRRELHGRI